MFLACHTSLEGKANWLRANLLCKFLGVDWSCIPFMSVVWPSLCPEVMSSLHNCYF